MIRALTALDLPNEFMRDILSSVEVAVAWGIEWEVHMCVTAGILPVGGHPA